MDQRWDEQGTSAIYAFEGNSVGEMMRRSGWSPNVVRPGDKVTIKYHPFRDGRNGGKIDAVSLPDGRTIGGGKAKGIGAMPAPERTARG